MPEIFKTSCSYCGVGCGIEILKHTGGRLELRGDAAHPANRGLLCSKGRSLLHTVNARATRLHYPVMRTDRQAQRQRVSWDQAISRVAGDFRRIIDRHGPDSVALYVSGQCLTEEYYLANKIARGFLQTNNIDTNSRLCMSSAVCGYKATLGADGPPVCYDDIDHCDTFFIAGANPAWCHPVLFRRIEARRAADPRVRIIVVDPRRTASVQGADLHLQLRPGTDVALFLGVARRLVHTNQIDRDFLARHTDGAHAFLQSAEPWTLARTAEVCGLHEADIARAADWLGRDDQGERRFLSMWTMGLNQSAVGTDKNIALIALSLITGKIGKPGCGPFSLTGQPNAMGGREVGGMATLLPAHRDLANPADRAAVARFWGVPMLPANPGLTAVELFDAVGSGRVKAVWIIATNPVASMPAAWSVEKALAAAELVVAQDIYPTETTDLADVILPAAGWLEKTGTMTNSERRLSLLEKAVDPPGEALADAEILQRFAAAMGWEKSFQFPDAAAVFAEHAALTAGTDIDITGLSHAVLKTQGPTQWPFPAEARARDAATAQRLYADRRFPTPTGRARLAAIAFEDRSESLSGEFPLILTTGRIRDQWHTMTKTGLVSRLRAHTDAPYCEIHPRDATDRGIGAGDIVTLRNSRGEVRVPARLTEDVRPGVVFLPMHWGKKLGGVRGRTNNLTSPRVDPVSKEPDLKFAAVQAERFAPARRRIVIVGAGAAALAFVEHHRKFNALDELVLLGGEPLPVYDRVMLPQYIEGASPWESLVRADEESLGPQRVVFYPQTLVSRIDRAAKTVFDARGRAFTYDLLILATGSRPAVHYDGPLPERGTFTLRTRAHADAILAEATTGRQAVIHGGGLLAVELADALRQRGCGVTILQRSERLMGKQLDAVAAGYLAEELTLRGIRVMTQTALVEISGDQSVTGVRVSTPGPTGATEIQTFPCDLFIFATGILPNKELAGAAGLDCGRGILVDGFLRTSDPSIFALGECAEWEGQTCGTTPAATAQARALAEFLRGNEHAPYRGTTAAHFVKLPGASISAVGETDPVSGQNDPPPPPAEVITLSDPARRHYQKCIVRDGRLVGAICIGDTRRMARYVDWISSGLELEDLRETLLRSDVGPAAAEGEIVCSCHQVGIETLRRVATAGADLERICQETHAGTGCGSCRPEIVGLLRRWRSENAPDLSSTSDGKQAANSCTQLQ